MTIKAQTGSREGYFEELTERLADRLLDAQLRADNAQAWCMVLGFWGFIATAIAILEAVT